MDEKEDFQELTIEQARKLDESGLFGTGEMDVGKIKIKRPLQLKIICFLLVLASLIHLLIVFGIMQEEGIPVLFAIYFDSLLIIDVLAAIGLWKFEKWGWYLVMYIAVTQIFTHTYLLIFYFQINQVFDRVLDIVIVTYFVYYFSKYEVRNVYLT